MSGQHARPRTHRSFRRPLTAIAVAAILVVGVDAVSYAATGSALLLGKINKAGAPTVVQNTGAGPALSLQTKSKVSAPFATNAKGKVTNLNADKVDGLDAAAIVAKARAAVDAATVNGKSAATIVGEARSNVDAATVNGKSAATITADARAATRAFALVNADGTVVSTTAGVVVTKAGVGRYCVSAPGFSPATGVGVVSTRDAVLASNVIFIGTVALAQMSAASGTCTATEFYVRTYVVNGSTVDVADQPFNVAIF